MIRERDRTKILTRRAAILGGGQFVLAGALAARLFDLQVIEAGRYTVLADENRISIRFLAPLRGRILDRFGVQLAANAPAYRAVIVAEGAGDLDATLDAVASLIPVSDADRRRVVREVRRKHRFVPVVIREDLTWEEMARLAVSAPELPGVSIEQMQKRSYPFQAMVSHAVGYVAAVSEGELDRAHDPVIELPDFRIGKTGIEKAYDAELRGKAGTEAVEVNAFGRVVRELSRSESIRGRDIVLSLDMALQNLAAERCAAEKSAATVVLDALSGEVLALVSTPGYDPDAFVDGVPPAMWQALTTDPLHPLTDKAIAGAYAPGSTFKPIVALAGLEAGAITPDTHFFCPGYFLLGDAVFHCWKRSGHGSLAVRDAIKHSCDVFFYNTAHRLGIDPIAAMATRFGLGARLGIEIPGERPGLVPTRAWKLAALGSSWQQGETISAGIGQSYVTETPLQLAIQAARLATGRVVMPRLVRPQGIITPNDRVAAAPDPQFAPVELRSAHLDLVVDGMRAVVNEPGGTAYAARIREPGLEMGGKSGTSQVRRISQSEREHGLPKSSDIPWRERDHALFIAFAPIDAPRYVCAVVVEHGGATGGGGSAVAAPICRDLLIEAQKRDPTRRVPAARMADVGERR